MDHHMTTEKLEERMRRYARRYGGVKTREKYVGVLDKLMESIDRDRSGMTADEASESPWLGHFYGQADRLVVAMRRRGLLPLFL
jgi:hypothetical protein